MLLLPATGYQLPAAEFADDISCCDPPRAARAARAGRHSRSPPPRGHPQAAGDQGLRHPAADARAVPRCRRQEPARRRRVLGDHSARHALLRRLHRRRRRRSDAARTGSLRAQQGARGGGAGLDLRGARILRSIRAEKLALVHEHPERTSRADPSRHSDRHRSDGPGLRGRAGICDRRPHVAALRRVRAVRRRRNAGRPDLGSGDVRGPEAPGQSVRDGRSQQRPARYGQPDDLPDARSRSGLQIVQLGGAQRRRHAVQRRLRRARAVPVRAAQRQADGDHLPRDERARRALRLSEQAQGDGARSAARAGDGAAGRPAARSRQRVHRVSRQASRLSRRRAAAGSARGVCRPDAPRRAARVGRYAVARAGHRPGVDHARSSARQADSSTTRRSCRCSIARRNTRPATSSRLR